MIELKNLKSTLEDIIDTLSNITNMEFAIFDTKSHLVSSTPLYLKHKGSNVHTASIEEVLLQGNVVVNKPGYMKSCIGCRFANNCPSTIEILNCIKLDNISIGVISLTSFSQRGHNLIQDNIKDYMKILENTSNLISMFAFNESHKNKYDLQNITVDKIINNIEEDLLIVDKNGVVTHCNPFVQQMFAICDLYTKSINQIFSKDITSWILNSKSKNKKYTVNDKFTGTIFSNPIYKNDDIYGYLIQLKSDTRPKYTFNKLDYLDNIKTNNINIIKIKEKISKISNSPSSVLITGETGTGKELIAKAIHYSSNRKDNPFVPINCANIPETLFESELFGYEEGAFTGAKKGGKLGLFELANGGTIFLDEIGELPMYLQAKILRVLQENTIQKLGSINSIPVDIRVISATNQNLEEMMFENKFRDDLYYRLNVIPIEIPPLRERKEDIKLLSYHFLQKYNIILNKQIKSISDESLNLLTNYRWPGNVRELENAIEYAVNMEESSSIKLENLPNNIIGKQIKKLNINEMIANEESNLIISTLNKYGWDVQGKEKASQELGISLRTLYRKLKNTNIN